MKERWLLLGAAGDGNSSKRWFPQLQKTVRTKGQEEEDMGQLYLIQLDGRFYSCSQCRSHLANCNELLSKAFHCRHGKAYLFNNVVNVSVEPQEDRMMTTGKHTVADIYCNCCQCPVGWKYESAYERTQKYKEGKFILERAKMIGGDGSEFYLDTHEVSSDADDE